MGPPRYTVDIKESGVAILEVTLGFGNATTTTAAALGTIYPPRDIYLVGETGLVWYGMLWSLFVSSEV